MAGVFGRILRDELNYQGMTVKELATKSAVAQGALNTYLGKQASMPPADTAVRIADALGVTVEYLVKGKESTGETNTSFVLSHRKRSVIRIFDDLLPNDQKLTFDFVKLLKKNRTEDND